MSSNFVRSNLHKQSIGSLLLLALTAFIWGMAFVAQRSAMEHIGPFLFNGLRQALGACTLFIVWALLRVFRERRATTSTSVPAKTPAEVLVKATTDPTKVASGSTKAATVSVIDSATEKTSRKLSAAAKGGSWTLPAKGVMCGCALFFASNLQQIGMVTTSASKAGFITTLYIVFVPLLGIAFRNKTHWNTWISVAVAVVGMYLLCMAESLAIAPGDSVLLVAAVFWALHILLIGRFVRGLGREDVLRLCIVQLIAAGTLSLFCSPLLDRLFVSIPFTLAAVCEVVPEIAYAGILSTGIAYAFQAIGQRYAPPSAAAIVMSLESVFALLGGVVLLKEALAGRESVGCLLMFAAVILAQLDLGGKKEALLHTSTSVTSKKED